MAYSPNSKLNTPPDLSRGVSLVGLGIGAALSALLLLAINVLTPAQNDGNALIAGEYLVAQESAQITEILSVEAQHTLEVADVPSMLNNN